VYFGFFFKNKPKLTSGSILTGGRARNGSGFSALSFQQKWLVCARKMVGVSPAN